MAADGPGGEKTEKPTPQRLKKARKEGQIPRTQELGTWLGVAAASALLPMLVRNAFDEVQKLFVHVGAVATHPEGVPPMLLFIKVPEPRTVKNRMHIDVSADNREAEIERLIGLGATRGETHKMPEYSITWTVLQDPEGNELCVAQDGEA